jgi:hypothetical protein
MCRLRSLVRESDNIERHIEHRQIVSHFKHNFVDSSELNSSAHFLFQVMAIITEGHETKDMHEGL